MKHLPTPSTIINVENVNKLYRIYETPQDRLKQMLFSRLGREYGHEFWALRDISFSIKKGETVGIIGRNGSGKSTLLQIIAGTLQPTSGSSEVNGRVAALLELGSGFNPEFTGRENVFLNGAILGISREEMETLFDKIVAFADIGGFIDQPVKLYSSGMVVRLAFAVQAIIPKEILIVDEALAVGDIFFQAKCMALMKQLIQQGVTILFVSHDINSIKSLCSRAILLSEGKIIEEGSAEQVAEKYFEMKVKSEQSVVRTSQATNYSNGKDTIDYFQDEEFQTRAAYQRVQNNKGYFANVQLLDNEGNNITFVNYGQHVTLRLSVEFLENIDSDVGYGYHIRNANGVDVVYSDSYIEKTNIQHPRKGSRYIIDWAFNTELHHGNHNIAVVLSQPIDLKIHQVDFFDFIPLAVQFVVAPREESYIYGAVHWPNEVQVSQIEPNSLIHDNHE